MRALAVLLLVVLGLLAGAAAALLWFPAPLLRAALQLGGLEAVRFEAVRLGADRLVVDDLRIGPQQRIARLELGFHAGDLLRGRLARLELAGVALHGRLADGRLELPGLPAIQDGETPGDQLALPWPERLVVRSAEIRLATPWGTLQVPLTAEAELADGAAELSLTAAGASLVEGAGRLQADLSLTADAPAGLPPALDDVEAQGRLTVAAERLALPALADGIEGRGEVAFTLAEGRFEARLDEAVLQLAGLAPQLAALRAPLPPPWRIEIAEPLRLGGALAGGELSVDGALRLAAGPATVELDLAARLADRQLDGTARAALRALRWPAATLEQGTLELAGGGPIDGWQGTLDLTLAGSGRPAPALALAGLTLRHQLAVHLAGRQLVIDAREDGALALERLTYEGVGEAGPLAARLPPAEAPLLSARWPAADALSWQHHLRATGEGFDFASADGLQGRAALGTLTLALAGDRDGLSGGRLALAEGRLRLPAQQLTLEGIASAAAFGRDGLAPGQTIPITVGTISHGATPAWFAPLDLQASLRPGPEALGFEGRLSAAGGGLELALQGRHELASGRGSASVALTPVTFAPGALQPAALAPVSAGFLSEVAGTLALDGSIAWGAGEAVGADLALLVADLAFSAGPARFSQVNGVIDFDRLWPPSTPPGQQLAIGLVDLGLPLTRGLVAFELRPEGALAVERLRWDFAGGTVAAAPFRVGSAASDMMVTLSAERLDLAQLFALTRLDGLSGEGTIEGTLPLRISGVEAVVEDGELRATGPGWLRYRSDAVPAALQAGGENVSLLLQALENFRYEALRITLDGRTDAEMDIGLHVEGANPDLYDGYPIEFNLNLEGELANILRSGLASYQIPERIRERMQGFRR